MSRQAIASPRPIHDLFAETAHRVPDRVAIDGGAASVRYADLYAQARQVAAALRQHDVRHAEPVGLLMSDRASLVAAMIGTLTASAAFVPIASDLPEGRIAAMLDACPLRLIVGHDEPDVRDRLAAIAATRATTAGTPILVDPRTVPPPHDLRDDPPRAGWQPDDRAYVFFTSGSTATPKAIAGRFCAIAHYIDWEIGLLGLGAGSGVRVSQLISPAFDAIMRDTFVPLCTGGTICVPDDPSHLVRDGAALARWLTETGVELVHCVPSVLRSFLVEVPRHGTCASLRYVLVSGERLLPSDVQLWLDTVGPRTRLFNLYGPSETTMTKFVYEVAAEDVTRRTIPIGRPIPGATAIVVDEGDRPCPAGMAGEILIRTPFRALGYYDRPDLTAQVFVPNPLRHDPQDLVYRTGDLGRVLEDGTFEFLGRRDQQVKIAGVRIEPAEIESVARSTGLVRDIAVIAQADEERTTLVAYVVATRDDAIEALREQLTRTLPNVMVPSIWVALDALPHTATGKLDRRALPAPRRSLHRPPRTVVEEMLCGLWGSLVHRTDIGLDDDFFAIGGHSLLATRMLSRVQSTFGVDVPLRALFTHPTVIAFARELERRRAHEGGIERSPLRKEPIDGPIPLSSAQQRLWIVQQMDPESAAYHVPLALRIDGDLDLRLVRRAWTELIARHEILRTRVVVDAHGEPHQHVDPAPPPLLAPVPLIDLSPLGDLAMQQAARALADAEVRRPFDLTRQPGLRVSMLRLGARDHLLLATLHHIMCDAWSIGLLVHELGALYHAAACGVPDPLPPLAVRYADYARWERAWLDSETLAAQRRFWEERLRGVEPLDLPLDRARSARGVRRGGSVPVVLPPALATRLGEFCRRENVTVFMTLLAAWQVLLSRYSGQRDITVGCPIANRPVEELGGLIGLFANTLVLRLNVDRAASFQQVVRTVRATVLDAHANQDVPFEMLVETLAPAREPGRHPLFQVLFAFQAGLAKEVPQLPGLRLTRVGRGTASPKFELLLGLTDGEGGIRGAIEYAADLFDTATIERLADHYVTLLDHLVTDPAIAVGRAPIMRADERTRVLRGWNDTRRISEARRARLLPHELIEAQTRRTPRAIAITDGPRSLTYEELDARAEVLAGRLRDAGAGPGVHIGLAMDRSPDLLVALLGIMKTGAAYVPIDPAYPAARRAFMMHDASIAVLLTDDVVADNARLAGPIARVRDETTRRRRADLDDPAYVLYTSGSTGQAKGVVIPHGALVNLLESLRVTPGLTSSDAILAHTTLSFDIAVVELLFPLTVGARIVMARGTDSLDGRALAELIAQHGVTTMSSTPATWRLLVDAGWSGTPGLTMITAGEELTRHLAEALRQRGQRLWNAYGPTETTVYSTIGEVGAEGGADAGGDVRREDPILIGHPLANTQCYVLDRDDQPLPPGVVGSLSIGGLGLSLGYQGRPALTAERFVPDPFSDEPGARLYRTGDRVRHRAAGALEFLGRSDFQVKLRGFRIEPGEVEAALVAYPSIGGAVVLVREDPSGEPQLVAYVTPASGERVDPMSARAFVRQRLPAYMVPASIQVLPSLPRTPNGKIDRRALPAPTFEIRDGARHGPRENVEAHVRALWEDVLGVEGPGIHDDFFLSGGHSLHAIRLATLLGRAYGLAVPPHVLFTERTIEQQAAYLRDKGRRAASSCAVPLRTRGSRPPLFCVHPLGGLVHLYADLAHKLGAEQPFYGLQAMGFGSEETPCGDLRVMAARYIDDLRQVQPEGPYRLAGWSMGAPVAFEMARQLQAAGEAVSHLVLLDGSVDHGHVTYSADERAVRLAALEGDILLGLAREQLPALVDRLADLPIDTRVDAYAAAARNARILPPDVGADHVRLLLRVMAHNQVAMETYAPEAYAGPVTLIRSAAADGSEGPIASLRPYLRGALDVHEIAAAHNDFLRPPMIDQVAAALRAVLDPAGAAVRA
jgi:amino acid adenylation domain-containing protein